MLQYEGQGELDQSDTGLVGEDGERFGGGQLGRVPGRGDVEPGGLALGTAGGGLLGARTVAAGEPAAGEGLQDSTPSPYRCATGSTSRSMPRASSEYGGCSATTRSRPRRSAVHWPSTIAEGSKVEVPM